VKYWLHGEFLILNEAKMAKSGESFITLQTVIDRGFDPLDYRYFCLGAQYRSKLSFTWDALQGARNGFQSLKRKVVELKAEKDAGKTDDDAKSSYQRRFQEAIDDDLNMPIALATLHDLLKDDKVSAKDKLALLFDWDRVLGLKLDEAREEPADIPDHILNLLDAREAARKAKDFKLADKVRDDIQSHGFIVEDSPTGQKVRKA
jgi:cysteinyl-tRNA synthetase